jgi:hypothetical protein
METTTEIKLELGTQIMFDRPNSLIICRVTRITDKAVECDYALEPVSVYGHYNVTVFTHKCWIPKSVIIQDPGLSEGSYTVKKWFEIKFSGGPMIKNYFISTETGKQVFV